jgi:hypothetical protein
MAHNRKLFQENIFLPKQKKKNHKNHKNLRSLFKNQRSINPQKEINLLFTSEKIDFCSGIVAFMIKKFIATT